METYTGLRWGILKQRTHLEDLGVDGKIIRKYILKICDRITWSIFMSLGIGTCSGLL